MVRILCKMVVVDELSLHKEEEVCVKTKCLDSGKLWDTVRVFFDDLGYHDLKIRSELPNHIGRPRSRDNGYDGAGDDGDGGRDDHFGRGRHHHFNDEKDFTDHTRSPSKDPPPLSSLGDPLEGESLTWWIPSCGRPTPLPQAIVMPRVPACWWFPRSRLAPRPRPRSLMLPPLPSPVPPLPPQTRARGVCRHCPLVG
ncbi:hypothetical protein D1007_26400 [Hordeum vulgare]|nr:hypothetical protein D1007_26400 [Hordeum vulgare]